MRFIRLRWAMTVGTCVTAIACSGAARHHAIAPASTPRGEPVEITEGHSDLRPIAFGAASYLKQSTSSRIGFFGVVIDRVEIRQLSDEIGTQLGLVMRPRIACTMQISGGGGSADNCQMDRASAAYSFTKFRRLGDSAFVGMKKTEIRMGRTESSDLCVALAWRDAKWNGIDRRNRSAEECGR